MLGGFLFFGLVRFSNQAHASRCAGPYRRYRERTLQRCTDDTLGLQPSKPADLCASTQAMGDEWLQERARP